MNKHKYPQYRRVAMPEIKDVRFPNRMFYRFEAWQLPGIGSIFIGFDQIPDDAIVECGYFKTLKHAQMMPNGGMTKTKWVHTTTLTGAQVKAKVTDGMRVFYA